MTTTIRIASHRPPAAAGGAAARALALALALGLAALAGCRAGTRESPRPTNVVPSYALEGPAVAILIKGANFDPRAYNDFGGSQGGGFADATFAARLGDTTLRQVRLDSSGNLTAIVPEGLPARPDAYDLTIVDPWGNEGVLPGAFRVLAVEDLSKLLAGFRIAPIDSPQRVNVPFTVTVEAIDTQGNVLAWFNDAAKLTDLTGAAVPTAIGFFVDGVWTGQVEVRAQHAANVLSVDRFAAKGQSNPFAVVPRDAVALHFTNTPRTALTTSCSEVLTVSPVDASGFATTLSAAKAVELTADPPDDFKFYDDAACTHELVEPTLAADARELRFYFKSSRAGTVRVTAAAPQLLQHEQLQRVDASAPSKLVFVSTPQTVVADACSGKVELESRDAADNPAEIQDQALPVALAGPADAAFYPDLASCQARAGAVTSVDLPAGETRASFFFRATRAGAPVLRATANGGAWAVSQTETVLAAAPARLQFNPVAGQTLIAGDCSAPVALEVTDAFGNPSSPNASVALTANGLELTKVAGCGGSMATALDLDLTNGATSKSFWFRGQNAGDFTVIAQLGSIPAVSQTETIRPRPASELAFITAPQTLVAGDCSGAVTLESRDSTHNPRPVAATTTVALGADSGITFFSDPLCAVDLPGASSTVQIAAGSAHATFFFKGTIAGTKFVEATAGGWPKVQQPEQIRAAAAVRVAYLDLPAGMPAGMPLAGDCTSLAVALLDRFNNEATATADRQVGLGAAPSAGFTFYSDASCLTQQVGSPIIRSGTTRTALAFIASRAGPITLTATTPGLTGSTQNITVAAKPPARIVFTTPPRQITAGACTPVIAVQSQDALGNPVGVSPAAPISLTSTGSNLVFYSDGSCTQALPLAVATIPAGGDTVSFYARATTAGNATVQATATGFGLTIAQPLTVDPGSVAEFAWDAIASPQPAFAPFAVALRARDVYGNLTPSFTGDALLTLLPLGAVSCESSCGGAARTAHFANGVWSGVISVDSAGSARRLVAASGSVIGTSAAFDVTAGPTQSPPRARLVAVPGAVVAGTPVTLDAGGSRDYQTATASLETAWDGSGSAAGAAPWAGGLWTAGALTRQATYAGAGVFRPRVAVRDAAGEIGYASGAVVVVAAASDLCTVDTASLVDDGATACTAGSFGPDGKLSLAEALRIVNTGGAGAPTAITFASGLRIEDNGGGGGPPASLSVTRSVSIAGRGANDTVLAVPLEIGTGATVTLIGLELAGLASPLVVDAGGSLQLINALVRDGAGLLVSGSATLDTVRFRNCAGDCVDDDGGSALTIVDSEFLASPSSAGVSLQTCAAGAGAVDVHASVFAGLQTGVQALCGGRALSVRNVTFAGNQTGIRFSGGTGHALRNCVFSGNTAQSASCGTATFTARDYALLFGNGSDVCLAADASGLTGDPLFVDAAANDYRLAASSPALESALDLSLDVDGPAPGNFLGSGPDRGGAEWY